MDDYIAKPIRPEELFGIVERLFPDAIKTETEPSAARSPAIKFNFSPVLASTGGDVELAHELINLFVEDSPAMITEIRRSIAGNDARSLARAAHAFKSAIGFFPASGAAALVRRLEETARAGDLSGAPEIFAELEREVDLITVSIKEFTAIEELTV